MPRTIDPLAFLCVLEKIGSRVDIFLHSSISQDQNSRRSITPAWFAYVAIRRCLMIGQRDRSGPHPIPFANGAASFRNLALVVLSTGLGGCIHRMGPQSIPRDRSAYSVSLSDSWKEETLLNIVKLRYLDPPLFVDVGNIVASYTLAYTASAGGTISPNGGGNATLGGSAGLTSSPTITYTPLTGNAYIAGLITPLPAESLFNAMQNGIPADSVLLLGFLSINGLRNQSVSLSGITPADPDFHRVRTLMRDIQLSGAVRLYVKENADKQQKRIIALRTDNIPPQVRSDIAELRRLLHLNPDAKEFELTSAPLPSSDTELAVQTRSISELLQIMAAEVEVPAEDVSGHKAFPGFASDRDLPGIVRLVRIRSSKQKPGDALVSVRYRDKWFWISDDDLVSKLAFVQLLELFTMTDTEAKQNLPVVTIPAR